MRAPLRSIQRRGIAGFLAGAFVGMTPFFALARGADVSRHPLPYQSHDKTLGIVTCASSLCHGSVAEWSGSHVRQNEYVTWLRLDKHAGAARLLLSARSRRIVANLGLTEAPEKAEICLDCHAHNPDASRQGTRARVMDGVTCEGCHGPAEKWVASHSGAEATHAQSVARGMYPTDRPIERARLCLSCHFGNEDRFVSHRMMGAGHPRLSFELETFTALAPQHFTVDADYQARKGDWNGAKAWAIGQALAVSETMKILDSPTRARDGLFPELAVFDCYACHRPMSQARWTPDTPFGRSVGPGTARLNESNLVMLRAVLRQVEPALAESVTQGVKALRRAIAGDGDVHEASRTLEALAETAATRISDSRLDDRALGALAVDLVDDGIAGGLADYAAAEQSFMGLGSLLDYMLARGLVQNGPELQRSLDSLRETLRDPEQYRPNDFAARLPSLRRLIPTPSQPRQ